MKALVEESDLILVIGSRNSSNSKRLVEVAERHGCPAFLIDDETDIEPDWLLEAETVGITAGASAPERLVQRVTRALERLLGAASVEERTIATETTQFKLPLEVRR